MIEPTALTDHLIQAFGASEHRSDPFTHWLLAETLPENLAHAVTALYFDPPPAGDGMGRRETHNATRVFFSPDNRARFPAMDAIATALQDDKMVRMLAQRFGAALDESHLRIEYCRDVEGFWLEPHTDIAAKLITILIYLSSGPEAANWGTDLYDSQMNLVGRAPGTFNAGLVFVPGSDTWHGYEKRPMAGLRQSIIINFVKSDWRSRHELAFPDRLARAGIHP